MSLNIDYLQQLSAFTKFANIRINAEDKNAVACITQNGGNVQEISKNSLDKPYAFFPLVRSRTNKQMNNETRALFKNTIANLFGGEDKIPQSVKDDMHFGTFDGKGHPLTAKRINIVKNSILKAIRENPYAGISEGEAMRILNAHGSDQIIDEPINRDSLTNTKFSINDDGDENYGQVTTNNKKLETLAKELNKRVEEFNPQKKTSVNNSNVSGGEDPKTFDEKMKMFQKKNMVFGQAGFVLGKGNPVMEGRKTGTNEIKNDTHDTEKVDEKYDTVQVVRDKKPKTKKPKTFTED